MFRILSAMILICFSVAAYAQRASALKNMRILTSDSLAGRGYVENGMHKSAAYIADQLDQLGVEPAIEVSSFFQEITPFSVNTFPSKITFNTYDKKQIPKIFTAGKDFLLHPASASMNKEEVELNYLHNEKALDRIKSNKAYYINKHAFDKEAFHKIEQAFIADERVENSLLVVYDSTKLSWYPSQNQAKNAVIYSNQPIAEKYISANWKSVLNNAFQAVNVIGKILGKRNDSAIFFSAHYDHLGKLGEHIFPGANDNASGVALLLTLAEHYSNNTPEFDTYFLFTTAEEIGLLGSYYYVTNPLLPLNKIKLLVNLDLVGTGEEGITIVNGTKHSKIFDLFTGLNETRLSQIKARGEACNSDHCFFDKAGVPAIFIYTLGGSKAYHDIHDNISSPSLYAFNQLQSLIIDVVNSL